MTINFRQMILCPKDADFSLESSALLAILAQLGLTGASLESCDRQQFLVGEHFLQHISFMGCAPAVEFAPEEESGLTKAAKLQQFIFVHVPESTDTPRWLADLDMAKPTCPACKKRFHRSSEYIDKANMTCPHCGQSSWLCDFAWREFGGCAKTLVSIVNAYPKETIPSGNLLNQLAKLTGVEWEYFYFNGPLP